MVSECLTIWKKELLQLIFHFFGKGFLGVALECKNIGTLCIIVNVYSSCHLEGKKRMSKELAMTKRGFSSYLWCIGGDFKLY